MPKSDASRIGKAAEHLVAASCILASRGELNVSTALVDDEGVEQTFRPRMDFHLLFVAVNLDEGRYETAWLVPSEIFDQRARPNPRARLRFSASLKTGSSDQWRPYRLTPPELPVRILDVLSDLESRRRVR